jgi:hypothetical protein
MRPVTVFALLALAACGDRTAVEAKRQSLAEERRAMDRRLDQLEARLLTDQASVRFWREMRDRHEGVAAVACTNLERHAEGMALLQVKQREKVDARSRKNRVAARFVPPADAVFDGRTDEH